MDKTPRVYTLAGLLSQPETWQKPSEKPQPYSNAAPPPASTQMIAREIGKASLLLGLPAEAGRIAVLAEALTMEGLSEHEVVRVCHTLSHSPEVSDLVCRHGAIIPAHFRAAYVEAFRMTPEQRRMKALDAARQAARLAEPTTQAWLRGVEEKGAYLAPRSGAAENRRRLKEGTPPMPERETPEWNASWSAFHERGYVADAREKARQHLANHREDEP